MDWNKSPVHPFAAFTVTTVGGWGGGSIEQVNIGESIDVDFGGSIDFDIRRSIDFDFDLVGARFDDSIEDFLQKFNNIL